MYYAKFWLERCLQMKIDISLVCFISILTSVFYNIDPEIINNMTLRELNYPLFWIIKNYLNIRDMPEYT